MRKLWCSLAVLCLLSTGVCRADDQAEMKALIDKAIKAAGGEAKLNKLKMASLKVKGAVTEDGKNATISFDGTYNGLDQFRMDLELQKDGKTEKALVVVNGNNGWAKTDKGVEEAPKEILPAIKAVFYGLRLSQTLTPLKGKDFTLSPLGEVKVNDKPAIGIKVTCKDRADISLYLDKETSLPVKCEMRVKEDNDKEVTLAFLFSDHKDTDGVKHFRKATLLRDDKQMLEAELTEIKPVEKVDESMFAKPE